MEKFRLLALKFRDSEKPLNKIRFKYYSVRYFKEAYKILENIEQDFRKDLYCNQLKPYEKF
jgi:hypothetical protein